MPTWNPFRLILSLLLAATSIAASPSQAQTLDPTLNISNTKANAWTSHMAVSDSNVDVVWDDDKGSHQVLFARSTGGSSFSTAIQIFSGLSTGSPHVAATGPFVYVARSARSSPKSPSQIYFRRSTDYGASFGTQIQVSNTSGDGAFFDAMAISGSNVYIVWRQWIGNWALFFARSTNSGAAFGTPVNLSGTSGDVADAELAADGSGVHVAWSVNSQIYYRRSTTGGLSFDGAINVSNNGNVNVFPALAVSGSSVYLAWREHASGEATPHIFFARSIDAGVTFPAVVDLSGPTSDTRGVAGGPQLAASGSDVHVIWHANPGGGNNDVFYTGSIAGGAFGGISNISCGGTPGCALAAENSPSGVIAVNGANVYISWSGGSSTAREIYLAHSGTSGVTFGTTVNASSTAPADSGGPQLVAASADVHLIWLDHMPGNWDVFYRHGMP